MYGANVETRGENVLGVSRSVKAFYSGAVQTVKLQKKAWRIVSFRQAFL